MLLRIIEFSKASPQFIIGFLRIISDAAEIIKIAKGISRLYCKIGNVESI